MPSIANINDSVGFPKNSIVSGMTRGTSNKNQVFTNIKNLNRHKKKSVVFEKHVLDAQSPNKLSRQGFGIGGILSPKMDNTS